MSYFSTELYSALTQGLNLDEIIRQELEKALNEILKTELTVFLDYERYDPAGYNSGNSRNGSYERSIDTKYGTVQVQIPRDRNGEFSQQTIPAYTRRNGRRYCNGYWSV